MTLQAYQLLITAASIDKRQQERFSRKEIEKKINEIKYLSAQKKVPKLTLRKEILILEQKMKNIAQLEEELEKTKRRAAKKIEALQMTNEALQKRLALSGDKDVAVNVNKLSHLLGDCLAQQEAHRQLPQELRTIESSGTNEPGIDARRIEQFQQRVQLLKQELDIQRQLQQGQPEKIRMLQEQVSQFQKKLDQLGSSALSEKEEISGPAFLDEKNPVPIIKHDLLLDSPPLELEAGESDQSGLPLPPPPKRRAD